MSEVEARQLEALSPEHEREVKRLVRLIERTDSNVIAFALFAHIDDKKRVVALLQEMLKTPISNVPLAGDVLNPLNFLTDIPKTPRHTVNFTFVGKWQRQGNEPSELEKLAGYLNIQREGFSEQPHAAIFWLTEAGLDKIMNLSPDFWSWQSGGVFDFAGVSGMQAMQPEDALPTYALSEEIIAQYRQGLEEAKTIDGDTYRIHEKILDNFSYLLYQAGHFDEAERLCRKALEIDKTAIGENHPNYAIHLNNLALVLESTGQYEEAERLCRQALDIGKTTIGENHPSYAIRLSNLANVLEKTGQYEEAERLYRQALEIDKTTIGENHPSYATHLNNLANVLRATGQYAEAERLYQQAHTIFLQSLGENHPHTQQLADTLERFKS